MSWPGHQTWLRHFVPPPPPPPPNNFVLVLKLLVGNNKTMLVGGQGRSPLCFGFYSIPHLTTVSQQFCHQGSDVDQKVNIVGGSS